MRSQLTVTLSVVLVCGLVPARPVAGQEDVRRVTLDEAVQLFGRNNLDLQVARASTAATAGAARQTAAYPNPVASVTHESVSDLTATYAETYYTLTQPIDWPWRYGSRRSAGAARGVAANAALRADSAQLLFELKAAYVDAAAAEVVWNVVDRVTEVFRQAERSGTERVAEGDLSRFELTRLRVELARYERLWTDADLALARLRRELTRLTDPAAEVSLAPVGLLAGDPPALAVDPILRRAESSRPEIDAATAEVAAARAQANATRGGWLTEPSITGGYKRQSDGLGGLFLGVALPIPLWNQRGADAAAATARVEVAERSLDLTRARVSDDVHSAAERYEALATLAVVIREELLRGADDLLDVALLSYEEGELSLLALLDAAEAYREAIVTKTQLSASSWIAYFDLERAVGGFATDDGRSVNTR